MRPEPHRDILDQGALVRERLRAPDNPVHAIAVRRREDLFGRDVGVARHAILSLGRTAQPLVAIGQPHAQIGAGTTEPERSIAFGVEACAARSEIPIVGIPRRNRVGFVNP
jgi:hypothetical protein